MPLNLGQIYADKYRIVRVLGEGAMGEVYEAENIRIRRRVAIKVLHPHVAEKQDTLRRFEREAQAAGRIGSQHIIEVLDLGELPDGSRFMVMEFLEGTTLDNRIRSRGRLTPEEVTPLLKQLLAGLGAAHEAKIIHRDLKPANIFVATGKAGGDLVKILDFGVSKFNVLNDEMSMTSTGAVLGTPYYMSPEQAKGSKEVDPRSDLYACGVILYECITGQVPFSAETFNELLFRIVLESPPPVESFVPDLDPLFTAIVHKSMARDANERYQTAREFSDALDHWLSQVNAGPILPAQHGGMSLAAGGTMMMANAPPAIPLTAGGTMMMPDRPGPKAWGPGHPNAPTAPMPAYNAAPDAAAFGAQQGGYAAAPGAQQGGYAAAPGAQQGGYGAAPAGGYAPAPGDYPAPPESIVIPKQGKGALAFAVGLLGVLVIGVVVLLMVRWSSSKGGAAEAATATTATGTAVAAAPSNAEPSNTAAATASAAADPAGSASAAADAPPTPTDAPAAATEAPAVRQPPAAGGAAASKGPGRGGPKPGATGAGKAGPAAKNPGKRTISTEL